MNTDKSVLMVAPKRSFSLRLNGKYVYVENNEEKEKEEESWEG